VHTPVEHAEQVAELTVAAAEAARTLVFPGASVAMPVKPVTVSCYGDAK
jgi:DNA polymerase-1